jgi:hypothetical protein
MEISVGADARVKVDFSHISGIRDAGEPRVPAATR